MTISERLKQYVPRGLYGRSALILLVPVVTLQLVVSVVFLQRHFEGVTRQMTENLAVGIAHVVAQVNAAPTEAQARQAIAPLTTPLALEMKLPGEAIQPRRIFYDISGLSVISTLRDNIPGLRVVDLGYSARVVRLLIDTTKGPLEVQFERRRVSASNPHQLLVLMVMAGLLMTVISFIFLRNQLRPIRRLARAAAAFGRGESVPYKPSGATEVRAAGSAFLDMRARIERQIEQRTLMLSGVSHDLRTPLTRMKLEMSMMEDSPELEALRADVDEMERLVDTFLAYVRSETQDERTACDPRAVAEAAVARACRAGLPAELGKMTGEGEAALMTDAVGRALDNLIGNAVRYGRRAVLSVATTDRAVRFRVEDDGPGIPADQREEALRAFTRLDPSRNQDKGSGVGLGLAIAFDIARRHGGTLRLGESEDLGGLLADLVLAR